MSRVEDPVVIRAKKKRDIRQLESDGVNHVTDDFLGVYERNVVFMDDMFYFWEDGRHRPVDLGGLMAILRAIYKGRAFKKVREKKRGSGIYEEVPAFYQATPAKVKEVAQDIANATYVPAQQPQFWINPTGLPPAGEVVAFRNCLVHVAAEGGPVRLEHTPNFFTTHTLPFDYDPAARAMPLFERLIHTVFLQPEEDLLDPLPELSEENRRQQLLLQECAGLFMTAVDAFHMFLNIFGPVRGGKGAVMRVIWSLVPPGGAVAIELEKLAGDFSLQKLVGARLAVDFEARIGDQRLRRPVSNLVVALTSFEDYRTIRRKFKTELDARLFAKLAFISNGVVDLVDETAALAARGQFIQTHNSWQGREERGLDKRIIAAEMPAVANWAIAGIQRLISSGRFTETETTKQMRALFAGSAFKKFVAEECELRTDLRQDKQELLRAFRNWCWVRGEAVSQKMREADFAKRVYAALPSINGHKSDDSTFGGLRLRPGAAARLEAEAAKVRPF